MSTWLKGGGWYREHSPTDFLSVADADLSNVRPVLKAYNTDKE